MKRVTRPLFVLHQGPAFRDQLRRVAESRFEIHWVDGWAAFPATIRSAAPAGLILVDPYHDRSASDGLAPALYTLLKAFPSATVIAACGARPGWVHDVRTLGEWGVAEVIDLESEDTLVAVRQRLEGARGRPLRSLVDRGLSLPLPGRGRAIVDGAAEVAALGGVSRDLAQRLGLSMATLLRWCRRSGLPVPRRLLVWMRLLLAAELLDDPGRTVWDVALACGYGSDDALRRALINALGLTPTELRERGAFATVSAAFVHELSQAQHAAEQAAVDDPGGLRPRRYARGAGAAQLTRVA